MRGVGGWREGWRGEVGRDGCCAREVLEGMTTPHAHILSHVCVFLPRLIASLPHSSYHTRLFPAFQNIRAISKVLSAHVAQHMVSVGLGTTPAGCTDWEEYVAKNMWTADQL